MSHSATATMRKLSSLRKEVHILLQLTEHGHLGALARVLSQGFRRAPVILRSTS